MQCIFDSFVVKRVYIELFTLNELISSVKQSDTDVKHYIVCPGVPLCRFCGGLGIISGMASDVIQTAKHPQE